MSLGYGSAPLSRPPGGVYNFDLDEAAPGHILFLESVQKRIRGQIAGETVVDTRRGMMLHETGAFPQWYVPLDDVRADVLDPSGRHEDDPFKGDTVFHTLRIGDETRENAAWTHPHPPEPMAQLARHVAFEFASLDAWFEEDDRIEGHPRDPYHRFDCRRTSEHVRVRVGGETIAETRRAIKLFETSIPPRYYIPIEDVAPGSLTLSGNLGYCPYKGREAFYSVRGGDTTVEDGAWVIHQPYGEADVVVGHVSFWGEGTEVLADGHPTPI